MAYFRMKLIQAGTTHYVDGMLSHEEAEKRLDMEEALHRAAGWSVVYDPPPGQLVLRKDGVERVIEIELAEMMGVERA